MANETSSVHDRVHASYLTARKFLRNSDDDDDNMMMMFRML